MICNDSKFNFNVALSEVLVAAITVLKTVNFQFTVFAAKHICFTV